MAASPEAEDTLISIAQSLGHQHRHPSESVQYLIKWAPLHFTPLFTSERPPHTSPPGVSTTGFFFSFFFDYPSIPINQHKTLNGKTVVKQILDKSPEHCFVVVFGDFFRTTRSIAQLSGGWFAAGFSDQREKMFLMLFFLPFLAVIKNFHPSSHLWLCMLCTVLTNVNCTFIYWAGN